MVEEYRGEDIESELGLDRMSMIYLAQLLGSDYCVGVHGVGIVNALEIISVFQGFEGGFTPMFRFFILTDIFCRV